MTGPNGPVTLPTLLTMLSEAEERIMGAIRDLRIDVQEWVASEDARHEVADRDSRARHEAINERFASLAVVEAERKGRWWAVHLAGTFLGRYGGTMIRLLVAAATLALVASGGLHIQVGG